MRTSSQHRAGTFGVSMPDSTEICIANLREGVAGLPHRSNQTATRGITKSSSRARPRSSPQILQTIFTNMRTHPIRGWACRQVRDHQWTKTDQQNVDVLWQSRDGAGQLEPTAPKHTCTAWLPGGARVCPQTWHGNREYHHRTNNQEPSVGNSLWAASGPRQL
jgi:hypothetical protein